MRSFLHKHCPYLPLWLRGFFHCQSGVSVMLVVLAMPVLARIRAKIMGRAQAVGDAKGVAAVEFAIIGPVLLGIMVGMFVFGVALNNYVMLTNAAQAGALQFAISRGASQPYTETTAQIKGLTPTLDPTKLTITLSVNGTVCASDSSCQTALAANAGKAAFVQASYPCNPIYPNLTVMGVNWAPNCTLTVKTTERIQ